MKYRTLGKTNWEISEIGLGTWQVGGKWGEPFDENLADRIIQTAIDQGINFIDTADVYSDGLSEKAVGKALKKCTDKIYVATKCGRRIQPHINEGYTPEVLRAFVENSLQNLQLDCIDLIQLHCPPSEVYDRPEIFDVFNSLKQEGKILALGVSVEKVDEALKAIEYNNVECIQIIYNMFRHKPDDTFMRIAKEKKIGVLARVPLASGLLSGKFSLDSTFGPDDHRSFNREGAAFDKGETFSGIPYELGIELSEKLSQRFGKNQLSTVALKWILMNEAVSCVIPGASHPDQVTQNVEASKYHDLNEDDILFVKNLYDQHVKHIIHPLW